MSSVFTEVFTGQQLAPAYRSYSKFVFSASLALSWPTQFQSTGNVVAQFMTMSASSPGLTVTLPDATQSVSPGTSFIIDNNGTNSFVLLAFDGSTITTMAPSAVSEFFLITNAGPTTQNNWYIQIPAGGGYTAVSSVNAATTGLAVGNLVISPGLPITTSGTITFNLGNDLGALAGFGDSVGIACRTAANAWQLRELVGTANQVEIASNPFGTAGNPTLKLASDITGLTSLQAGSLQLAGNTLSAFSNLNIILAPQAGGVTETSLPISILASAPLRFYAGSTTASNYTSIQSPGSIASSVVLTLPTAAPLNGQVLQSDASGNLSWATVAAFSGTTTLNSLPKFTSTAGAIGDSNIVLNNSGDSIVSGLVSITAQNLTFNVAANTIGTTSGNIILAPTGTNETQSNNVLSVRAGHAIKLYNALNSGSSGLSGAGAIGNNVWSLPIGDGTSNTMMFTNGAFGLGFSVMDMSYLSQAVVQVQGVATTGSPQVLTARYSAGVASVTKTTTTGVYTVTFTNQFTGTSSPNVYFPMVTVMNIANTTMTYDVTLTDDLNCNITLYSGASTNDFSGKYINIVFFGPRPTY